MRPTLTLNDWAVEMTELSPLLPEEIYKIRRMGSKCVRCGRTYTDHHLTPGGSRRCHKIGISLQTFVTPLEV